MKRIHIFGASGSGTTSLAEALATKLDYPHFDADNYFWLKTDPPFQNIRELTERQALLNRELAQEDTWTLSGSLCGWGDFIIPWLDLAVFLWLPPSIRMQRLKQRELDRYGPEIEDPGNPRYPHYTQFLDWASAYDAGPVTIRSRVSHEKWIKTLPCPVLRIEQDIPIEQKVEIVVSQASRY